MKLYDIWQERAQSFETEAQQNAYWENYFLAETENYQKILSEKTFVYSGKLADLAESFSMEPVVFAGFIDGINTSLETEIDLDSLEEDTEVTLNIVPEKLYYNMLAAKASWLYGLSEWDGVLSVERRHEITKEFRSANVFVREQTVGRNDPCPCGSGKKYKKCCGK